MHLCLAFAIWGTAAAPATATTAIVTGTEWVFVRRGPGNQFPPFARIPSGSTVEVQSIRNDWAQIVTASGQVGFIHMRFLSFPGEAPSPSGVVSPPSTRLSASPGLPTLAPTAYATLPGTATPVPTRTATEARMVRPTRTPTFRRTPSPTRTASSTRTPSVTRTTSPTRTASPTHTPAREVAGATRTSIQALGSPSPTATNVTVVTDLAQRARELEAELLATRQELSRCRQESGRLPLASCPEELRVELARLRAELEGERQRTETGVGGLPGATRGDPTGMPGNPTDNHVVSPVAVLLGAIGLFVGWIAGSRYTRRVEHRRRWRLRF